MSNGLTSICIENHVFTFYVRGVVATKLKMPLWKRMELLFMMSSGKIREQR
jgi:hypothetical protein